jgi:polyisoprenoid-binding protein YceI
MSTSAETQFPGYVVGTWAIDPVHSEIGFSVRHLMVSKVRGRFRTFEGQIVTAENPLDSKATITVDVGSIDTGNPQRDDDLRSGTFLDVANHPTMTYQSTAVRAAGDHYLVDGDLSLHGVTRPITLKVEVNGFGPDPFGGTRCGFSAHGELSRKDFGIDIDMPLDGGGVVLSDKIELLLEVEAILQASA